MKKVIVAKDLGALEKVAKRYLNDGWKIEKDWRKVAKGFNMTLVKIREVKK